MPTRLSTGAITRRKVTQATKITRSPGKTPAKVKKTFRGKNPAELKKMGKKVAERLQSRSTSATPSESSQDSESRSSQSSQTSSVGWDDRFPKPDDAFTKEFMAKEKRWFADASRKDNFRLPTTKTAVYVDEEGNACFNSSYIQKRQSKPIGANHPKIKAAERNNNDTRQLHQYWQHIKPTVNPPVAGIPRDGFFARRENLEVVEEEENFHNRPSINLPMPDLIKGLLVDDWENVTKNHQVVPLPHVHPVNEILDDYLAFERPNRQPESSSMDILEETVAGLREYFDKSLGRILLYRFERIQYHEMHKLWNSADSDRKSAVDTYGAEHLARLLVSLPELVAQTNMDQQSVNRLREELTKFTNWFSRNVTKYFVSEYETPGQDYLDKARNV